MTTRSCVGTVAVFAAAALGPGGSAHAVGVTAAELTWLRGCWASTTGEAGSGEQWTAPAGGSLLGTSRTVRDGRMVAFEFLRIIEEPENSLSYIAQPSGQRETSFRLIRSEAQALVFENPHHDFPQRITYRLDGDVLQASIEGRQGQEERVVRFPMRRTNCDG